MNLQKILFLANNWCKVVIRNIVVFECINVYRGFY
nr:MAG TPA: hypothetical protein [Caudoviricetes sp.]